MISKIDGMFILSCDLCGDAADETFERFGDAVDYKKYNGWQSQRINDDEWEDKCPECQEAS